jgi:hypothetical protein
MTTRIAPAESRPATWQHMGNDWHLMGAGRTFARIDRDGRRWLCYALDEGGNDYFLGQSRSLASGKAHLFLNYAPRLPSRVIAEEAAPM